MNKVFEAMEVIREFCKEHESCKGCPMDYEYCCGLEEPSPIYWDIKEFASKDQEMEGK